MTTFETERYDPATGVGAGALVGGAMTKVLHAKCVEPVKRNKDGLRWIVHRFPIKGGISLREAWLRDLARPPPMWLANLMDMRTALR